MTKPSPRVGGMLIGYYRLCRRKAWWSMRGIWMEQESDTVALGRLLDESSYTRDDKQLQIEAEAPDGTHLIGKIDRMKIKQGVLHETKKSRSCEDAHIWQVRFYLWLLYRNGVKCADGSPFTGQLDYPLLKRTEEVTLSPDHIIALEQTVRSVCSLAQEESPPPVLTTRTFCRKCSFEELCYA